MKVARFLLATKVFLIKFSNLLQRSWHFPFPETKVGKLCYPSVGISSHAPGSPDFYLAFFDRYNIVCWGGQNNLVASISMRKFPICLSISSTIKIVYTPIDIYRAIAVCVYYVKRDGTIQPYQVSSGRTPPVDYREIRVDAKAFSFSLSHSLLSI